MVDQQKLIQTIAALEAKRAVLGDRVVDVTISVLQEQLDSLQAGSDNGDRLADQRKQVTILFANVVGFTGVAESLPDTNMLNLLNLLWQSLDRAILENGGVIDKHMGDGVLGVFGVPVAQEDDPERAIRAALAMRAALQEFVKEMKLDRPDVENGRPAYDLQLRIGINTGPVLLGEVGSGEEYTVIGDTVNVASRLEQAAPAGGILISHETYKVIRGRFSVEPLGPVAIKGKSAPIQVYLVLGQKPRTFYSSGRGVEGVETRMVGRDTEMAALQTVVQQTVKRRHGRMVLVVGEAGVGKSRLMHEFHQWVRALPYTVPVFRGRADQWNGRLPYVLIRDLLVNTFGIQDNDPASVAQQKLVRGMANLLGRPEEVVRAQAWAIGQLIGMEMGEETDDAPAQVQERAIQYLVDLFAVISNESPATLLFLEDIHWADDSSLSLVERLSLVCREHPLMIIGLGRPELFEKRPFWPAMAGESPDSQWQIITLSQLSKEDSQELVRDILRKLPEIPDDLCELIVQRAEGNPFYVEELIKSLIEDGVIVPGDVEWRLNRHSLADVRMPTTLRGVLQARLDRLSSLERMTLQRAAVIGPIFWDTAVIAMNQVSDPPLPPAETISALQALEKRELIFRHEQSMFADAQMYVFKHAMLREAAYESVLLRDRPQYHRHVADWLAAQSRERVAEFASLIASHYEQAGEMTPAVELFELAAMRAHSMYAIENAIDYYFKALNLIKSEPHQTAWMIRLQEQVSNLLFRQGRLVEAMQILDQLRQTAELEGDLAAQAKAWNGMAAIHQFQGDYADMLQKAIHAEQAAWLVSAEPELIEAFLHKSNAYLQQEDHEAASMALEGALTVAEKLYEPHEQIRYFSQIGAMSCQLEQLEMAREMAARIDHLLQQMRQDEESPRVMGEAMTETGQFYNTLGKFDRAARYLLAALKLLRKVDYLPGVGLTLFALGETARLRGNPKAAVPLYREALSVERVIGNRLQALWVRLRLAEVLTKVMNYAEAETLLQEVLATVSDKTTVMCWGETAQVKRLLVQAYLHQGKTRQARELLASPDAT